MTHEEHLEVLQAADEAQEDLLAHLTSLKMSPDDIGSHSNRKGAATYATSGSTAGPSIIAVASRASWKIGGVLDKYLKYERAGDNYLGRVVAGLPQDKSQFAMLPHHFPVITRVVSTAAMKAFPSAYKCPSLRQVLYMALAAVVKNEGFLRRALPASHAVFSSYVFATPHCMSVLRREMEKPASDLITATGIPPHVSMMTEIADMRQEFGSTSAPFQRPSEIILSIAASPAAASRLTTWSSG
jgi:hypothetical protein